MEFTEKENRPEGINPSYVKCPKCNCYTDYWSTASNCKNEYIIFKCGNPKCDYFKKMWCEPDGVIVDER